MKTFKRVLCVLFALGLVGLSGCFFPTEDGLRTENDGIYEYCYLKRTNDYTLLKAITELPETVYLPSHYKGKEIGGYGYTYTPPATIGGGHERHYNLYMENVVRVYFPYNCNDSTNFFSSRDSFVMSESLMEIFFVNNSSSYLFFENLAIDNAPKPAETGEYPHREFYITENAYYRAIQQAKEDERVKEFHPVFGDSVSGFCRDDFEVSYSLKIANTAYMFNYEGAPNDGYYFINDFGYGGLIEDTPYKPLREGYTFGGWYKEPECINEWDFDSDTLPAAEYDDEGNPLLNDIKLYARWI